MTAMSPWQQFRTTLHMLVVGLRRRMVLGVRLVLVEDGKVLLVRHTYMPGWHFPGGGVEPGETAAESARREGLEETGYLADADLRLLGFYLKQSAATNRDHVAVYVATGAVRQHAFAANGEIAEIGWFAPDDLPEGTDPGTMRRIAELFKGTPPDERW